MIATVKLLKVIDKYKVAEIYLEAVSLSIADSFESALAACA